MEVKDRVIFITGGTTGLGRESIVQFCATTPAPKHIYFTGRNQASADSLIAETAAAHPAVQLTFLPCDQTSLAAVEGAVKRFAAAEPRLDLLVCNAGIMGKDAGLTCDGYELHFGVNHVAHALIFKMLLPALQQAADPRVIFLASNGFRWTPPGGVVFDDLKTPQDMAFAGRWRRYGQSKLANVVYAAEIAKRHPQVLALSLHPGVIKDGSTLWDTDLSLLNRTFVAVATAGQGVSLTEGVRNTVWAATAVRHAVEPGAFYEPVGKVGAQSKDSANPELGERLWNWTSKELEAWGN